MFPIATVQRYNIGTLYTAPLTYYLACLEIQLKCPELNAMIILLIKALR